MSIVMGIDAGGSKIAVSVCDLQGRLLGQNIIPRGLNLNTADDTQIHDAFSAMLSQLRNKMGITPQVCAACVLGAAGADAPENKVRAEHQLRTLGVVGTITVGNDLTVLLEYLRIVERQPTAAVLASGTGSICRILTDQGLYTAGGFGHWIGDEGSGYAVGQRILQTAAQMEDGRLEKTVLYDIVRQAFSVDTVRDVVRLLRQAQDPVALIASAARIAQRAAEQGDLYARQILQVAAGDLYALFRAAWANAGCPKIGTLYAVGSNLLRQQILLEELENYVYNERGTKLAAWQKAPDLCNAQLAAAQIRR